MTRYGLTTLVLIAAVLVSGCAKQPATMLTSAPPPTGVAGVSPMSNTASRQAAANPGAPGSTGQPGSSTSTGGRPAPSDFVAVRDLADIHFDFDKYTIRPTDADLLDQNARWLKANEKDLLLIEGHCDERGTNEYNLALGERRAKAAMNYLVAQGVAARRITIISYGEERPQCTDHNEACWAKNRRAHFLLKQR